MTCRKAPIIVQCQKNKQHKWEEASVRSHVCMETMFEEKKESFCGVGGEADVGYLYRGDVGGRGFGCRS